MLSISPHSRRSLVYQSFGSPLSTLELVENEVSDLPGGSLRVAMSLAPVNPSDLIPITGAYAHRIVLPAIAGYEGVGRVIEASPELFAWVGKRVLPLRGEGTWQTLVDCPAIHAIEVPDSIPDLVAARAYINPLAAITMLRLWPVRGKTVLLTGAGSSCANYLGRWAIQQNARRVVGLYRSETRIPHMRALGIEPVSMWDFSQISEVAAQANVTFDALGGQLGSRVLKLMSAGSQFVGYGLLSGQSIVLQQRPRAKYQRFHLRDHLPSEAVRTMSDAFVGIWPLLAETTMPEARIFPIGDWRNAIYESSLPGVNKPILDLSEQALSGLR